MSVKAEKTFEEIVERLAALLRWRPDVVPIYETPIDAEVIPDRASKDPSSSRSSKTKIKT